MKRRISVIHSGPPLKISECALAYMARFIPRAEELTNMLDNNEPLSKQPDFLRVLARYLYDLTIETIAIRDRNSSIGVSNNISDKKVDQLPYRMLIELVGSSNVLVHTSGAIHTGHGMADVVNYDLRASWAELFHAVAYARKNSLELANLYKYFDREGWELGGWPLIDQDIRAAEARVAAGEYGPMP